MWLTACPAESEQSGAEINYLQKHQSLMKQSFETLDKKLFRQIFKEPLTEWQDRCNILLVSFTNGGVAQLARAYGSYP